MAELPGRDLGTRRTAAVVVGITLIALAARLVWLDNRVSHWDEARVAWWNLRYLRTGIHDYRPIIHGPFLGIVNRYVFAHLGATDTAMRLPVAVIGGLLPATAWLLRERLGDIVTVALAGFLAANPLLLYYSRFMRSDVLVAAFMFAAFACIVRLYDDRQPRYLWAALACIGLGLTTKENALLYIAAWIGAGGLLLDHRLLRRDPGALLRHAVNRTRAELRASRRGCATLWARVTVRQRSDGGRDQRGGTIVGWKTRWTAHLAGAVGLGALIVFFFYAPRNPGPNELGLLDLTLSQALSDPGRAWSHLTSLASEAFVGSTEDFLGQWGSPQENAYLEYLGDYLQTMWAGAAVVSVLGVGGMLYDRYGTDGPTDLVSFASYWGLASVVGYPLATDIKAPWAAVHAVVALAIPAAVAAGLVGRWTAEAAREADWPGAGAGALVLLIVVGSVVAPAIGASFVAPTDRDNEMVQYAQPQSELRPVVDRMERVAARNEGTDVLVHGSHFVDGDTEALRTPACVKWFNALPLPWYLTRSGAQVRCTETRSDLRSALDDPPPVVVTRQQNNETVARRLPSGYEERTVELRLWGTETSFFFRERAG
jgi:uncharacterized protein (TIGR03663 family)